jgi:peroxiredoxin
MGNRMRRVFIMIALVGLVVIVAYILGSATGAFLRGREQRKIDNDYIAQRRAGTMEMVKNNSSTFRTGMTLPNHLFTDLDGNPVALTEVLGEKTVLAFYSTTCEYCKEEMELLMSIARSDEDWKTFVFISSDSTRALKDLRASMDERMRILYDENYAFCSSFFGFVPYPFTMIVDADGTVEDFMAGKLVEWEIEEILEFNGD